MAASGRREDPVAKGLLLFPFLVLPIIETWKATAASDDRPLRVAAPYCSSTTSSLLAAAVHRFFPLPRLALVWEICESCEGDQVCLYLPRFALISSSNTTSN